MTPNHGRRTFPAGLERFEAAGHRLAVLTNSVQAPGQQHLERSGLLERFECVIGVDEVGAYKPDGRAYACALDELGAAAGDAWLVAAHDWDIVGASRAGLRTAFVDRGNPRPVTVDADVSLSTLEELEVPRG